MTVKELKRVLENLNENLEVFIRQTNDDFPNSEAQEAKLIELEYKEDPADDKVLAKANVLLITDEY